MNKNVSCAHLISGIEVIPLHHPFISLVPHRSRHVLHNLVVEPLLLTVTVVRHLLLQLLQGENFCRVGGAATVSGAAQIVQVATNGLAEQNGGNKSKNTSTVKLF